MAIDLRAYDGEDKWPRLPCGGCTACCKGSPLLFPELGDDPELYKTIELADAVVVYSDRTEAMKAKLAIATSEDGFCIYREEGVGCTIDDTKPFYCRFYVCTIDVDNKEIAIEVREAAARVIKALEEER